MRKIKRWLIEELLPVWAKEDLLKEIDRLQQVNREQEIHIKQLDAYIDGLEYGIRNQRRIVINNNGEAKNEHR